MRDALAYKQVKRNDQQYLNIICTTDKQITNNSTMKTTK
jgi:hypothetical protein